MATPRPFRTAPADRPFRIGTGVVAALVLILVAAMAGEFGARAFIWGTLYSSLLALLFSTPVALGIAIFLAEMCPRALRRPLEFLTELLAAIPSIVYGLWGIFVLVPVVRKLEMATPQWLKSLP